MSVYILPKSYMDRSLFSKRMILYDGCLFFTQVQRLSGVDDIAEIHGDRVHLHEGRQIGALAELLGVDFPQLERVHAQNVAADGAVRGEP